MKCGVRSAGFGRFKTKYVRLTLGLIVPILLLSSFLPSAFSSEKWTGVDESVVEKYAKEHGRESREPLINTAHGDLLLFVFLLAGAVGGFIAGYYWKALTEKRANSANILEKDI